MIHHCHVPIYQDMKNFTSSQCPLSESSAKGRSVTLVLPQQPWSTTLPDTQSMQVPKWWGQGRTCASLLYSPKKQLSIPPLHFAALCPAVQASQKTNNHCRNPTKMSQSALQWTQTYFHYVIINHNNLSQKWLQFAGDTYSYLIEVGIISHAGAVIGLTPTNHLTKERLHHLREIHFIYLQLPASRERLDNLFKMVKTARQKIRGQLWLWCLRQQM